MVGSAARPGLDSMALQAKQHGCRHHTQEICDRTGAPLNIKALQHLALIREPMSPGPTAPFSVSCRSSFFSPSTTLGGVGGVFRHNLFHFLFPAFHAMKNKRIKKDAKKST
jgi:hypothetical protein